ncbi:hypothetical protein VOLCADRAFT_86759 [Volvox carteri f. nagariensis]|uniref:SMCHD1 ribosomal S5 domain-containing protein n=1 Tax=Volvox carteri f. nagariensis TaxID=3068 RepID=D8TJI8_VOLCA|nr:uncharacterized protein VOLCADRAFT_86759 [Volvox carteri f. nagariensis]EFJ52379.1 hypothetical protein VOLCADRAFT_86759 [Volvox carteri f. nagariensis]|eukprot:XP_002946452.1 hypothetical protein VOLCADRAFT_86759 [Volvox carteri f. nagariensis]
MNQESAARKLKPGEQLQVCLGSPGSRMMTGTQPAGTTGRSKPPPGASRLASSTPGLLKSSSKNLSFGSDSKPPAKERISFIPHPKTLTMAGDYEYFSARGHHPFAFALAELIDNSLRATKAQLPTDPSVASAERPRMIVVSLVVNERGTAGLIRVQDNGRGMSSKELGEWAIMNLSMEDRGLLPSAGQRISEQAGGGRYLSGDLSFFGVGSKNAAFFMGSSVKLATRQAGSEFVHELHIAGAELERRYRDGENVYEEDLIHREPGDASTVSQEESQFAVSRSWLAEEPAATSFTRVTIGDLRADVLSLVRDSESGAMVCRDLAHLYHYYLHGPSGNVGASHSTAAGGSGPPGVLPGGEVMPTIIVEYLVGSQQVWRRALAEVDDDLESRYVRAAKARMEFEVDVPGKGTVEGVMWYFPFTDGAETVPRELGAAAYGGGGSAGPGGQGVLTQFMQELPTQLSLHGAAALATQLARAERGAASGTQTGQLPEQMQRALADMLREEDLEEGHPPVQGHPPMFEAFWQGRLIPGSGLESLPFIDALRSKMRGSSSGKDYLPDEVFGRIRGALFFGPAWRVTRNKLTFRDPLPELLATAIPSDRAIEKRLREWLRDCHTRLDRILQFQGPVDVELKALVRKELGEAVTGFTGVSDGTRTISAGDIVRLSTKPVALGRVKYFAVPQAGASEGVYATGFVTFSGLPAFLHGPRHTATLNLRRIEGVVSPAVLEEFTSRERAKLPSSMRLEPIRFASGRRVDVSVGEVLPETTVALCNAAGQRLTRTFLQGQKVALRVRQRLVYLGPRRPSAYCSGLYVSGAGGEEQEAARGEQLEPQAVAAADANDRSGAAAAAAAGETAEPVGKKGRKRRKKNYPAAEAAMDDGQGVADAVKENQVPQPQSKRSRRVSSEADVGNKAVSDPAGATAAPSRAGAAGPLPEGVGELVLEVENKTPVDNLYQFSRITGGLTRSGTYFLEYSMLPDLPAGCDPSGAPMTIWSRTVCYATAGPAVRFELRGEARAVLATKAIALGETLPSLQLVCFDAQNNAVTQAVGPGGGHPGATVEVQLASADTGDGASEEATPGSLEEVQIDWQAVPTEEGLLLQGLRLTGGRPGNRGMRLFGGSGRGGEAQQAPHSLDRTPNGGQEAAGPRAPEVSLQLRVSMPDMPSQVLPLKLRPGPPAALRLMTGNPFSADAESSEPAANLQVLQPVCVMNGEALPVFQVLVLDAWGNASGPSADLPASLELEGPMLQPSPAPFDIDAGGVATVQGVKVAAPDASHIGARQDMRLSIRCTARGSGPRAALELAQASAVEAEAVAATAGGACPSGGIVGWSQLLLPLVVQPCTLPAGLQLLYNGEPCEVGPSATGDGLVAVLRNVSAGSQLRGLLLTLLDEGGRPAVPGFKGKLQVSWSKGSKKVKVTEEGSRLELPPLAVRDQVGPEPQGAWVRFVGDGPLLSGVTLETSLEVLVVAGPPVSWGVSLVESGGVANGGGGGPGATTSQATENLGFVACGALVCLEVEAHDAHGNRCLTWTGPGPRPTPVVVPTREQGDAPLLYDTADWVCGWDLSQQTGCEVYRVRMALGGSVGPVKLVVRDMQGPDGASLLQPDELPVELHAGQPTTIAFDGPQLLQCGTRGCLGDLRVRVTDDWGNLVENLALGGRGSKEQGSNLELTLQSSAIATDGSGNAAKVTKGCTCFREVKVEGSPGAYSLRVGSASRKVALREAVLTVEVVALNVVRHVAIAPCSLPEEPLEPGAYLDLQVEVTTEDGGPLPFEVARAGLSLRVKAPSAGAAAAARGDPEAAAAAAGGGTGGNSAAACTVVLLPHPPEDGASLNSRSLWTFTTPGPLLVAGEYSVTAEYVELRPELARALTKAEQNVRSVSHTVELLPGPPVRANLEQDPCAAAAGPITITNGSDCRGRTLLSSVAVQLRDEYGNAVALDGVSVRWVLGWPSEEDALPNNGCDGGPGLAPKALAAGAELPALQGASGDMPYVLEALTDSRGRAFFKELSVMEGTGRVGSARRDSCGDGDGAGLALHLELRLLAALNVGGGVSAGGNGGWVCCWAGSVVFSDDAARAATLQRLCAARDELAAAVAREEEAKAAAHRALDAAQQAVRQAQKAVEHIVRRAGRGMAGAPQSSAEAQELLQRLREQHQRATSASQQRKDAMNARYGPSTSGVVMALNRCLTAPEGQGEVVGVIAQLATVDNPHLCALLSAAFASTLQILVVRTYECIKRLREMLTANRNQLPSMLAINMVQGFTGDGGRQAAEMVAAMRNVSPEARALQAAGCDGADPTLPMLLPHTRMLMSANPDRVRAAAATGPAADEWPHGCLGYAVNLVRPIIPGHRSTIFYSQLGRTLVFETLDQAAAYRTYVVQALGCAGLGDIYTLDGGKLSGRGVVVGSGFRVAALEDAVVRFGAAQGSQLYAKPTVYIAQAGLVKQLSQQISDVEALAAALDAVEGASSAEAQALKRADVAAQRMEEARASTAVELQQLEREIAALAGDQPHAAGTGASKGKGGRGPKRSRNGATAVAAGAAEGQPDAGPDMAADGGMGVATDGGATGGRGQRTKRARGQGRMAAMQ